MEKALSSAPTQATLTANDLRTQIKLAASHGHGFYVYTLADDAGIFYVGKGRGVRVFAHGTSADKFNAAKNLRIAKSGRAVQRHVLAYFQSERDALEFERALICDSRAGLTNIASGGMPQDPKERASALASSMLAKLRDRSEIRPEWRPTFDLLRAEIEKEAANPSPTSITINGAGRVVAYGYCENHRSARPSGVMA